MKRRENANDHRSFNLLMDKRLYVTAGFILLLAFFRTTRTFSGHADRVPWYIGCFNNSEVAEDASFKPIGEDDQMTPVYCVHQCTFNESFRYAAVKNGSICICLTQIQQNNSINHTFCNVSCHGDKSIICGGTNASSVYSTAVPLVVSLHINLPKQVKTNTSITADAELSIKRPGDEVSNLDSIKQGNQTAAVIVMKWYSRDKFQNKTQLTLCGNQTTTSTVFLFATSGNHKVCVEAFNLFSHQKRCAFVGVIAPLKGLKLVTVFQGDKKLSLSSPLLIANSKSVFLKYLTASGSRPKFRFDFGDGSSPLTVMDTTSDRYSSVCSCITVSHVYDRCGNFTVNVTASNAVSLESVAQPGQVYVGLSVETVKIKKNDRDCMFVEANVTSNLTAVVKQVPGCAVFFQWNFNDSSPNMTTTAPLVSHTFSSSQSLYHVTVVAFNDHSRKKTTQQVCLQERLQGLILKPEDPHMIPHMIVRRGDEEETKFTVQLSPPFTGKGTVQFKLHSSDRKDPIFSGETQIPIIFDEKVGRFVVFAEAANQVSQVVSNKIIVSVLEPITGLSIDHEGTILLGKPVHLSARLKTGTNVTFHWDFGEGLASSTLNTTSRSVTYKFTKKGKYKINLIARNGIKDHEEEASITVDVTNVPHCYPPKITILGVHKNQLVNRSKEIRLEADVTLNCSETRELVYLWKITYTGKSPSVRVKPAGVSFTEQVLIIPPCVLDYGKHYFQLEVKVKGTGLSAENMQILNITKSPLVAVIEGGTTKVVSRENQKLIMDASSSHDPDFPDEGHNIRFYWSCNPLGNRNISCFNESRTPGMNRNRSVLTFQLDWLLMLADSTFQFTVTVSSVKDSRRHTALQILFVDTRESHLLSANCPQCDKGLINPSVPLVIKGLCLSCPLDNANIKYKWQLFHVGDIKEEKWEEEECQAGPIDSAPSSGMPNPGVNSTHKPSPILPPSQSQTTAANNLVVGTTLQSPTNGPVNSQTVKPTNAQQNHVKFAKGRICRDPDQILGPTSRPSVRHSTRRPGFPGSGGGSGSGAGGGFSHGKGSGRGSGGGWGTGAGQRTGSGTGTGTGSGVVPPFGAGAKNESKVPTTAAQQNFTTVAPVTNDNDNDNDKDKDKDKDKDDDSDPLDDIRDPTYVPPSAKHTTSIIRLKPREMRLPEEQTTTGLKSQNFVLLGKFLKGGRTYMVSFKVFEGKTSRQGKATVYFNTSVIPECGVCTVTPSTGVALETTFQLICSNWTAVGRGPLSFHISYSIDDSSEKDKLLIYSGYRSVVPFVLPAGLASSNHTVHIHVTVASGEGTKQRVQPFKVKVSPQTTAEGVTMEEVLLNETVGKYLSMLQEAGNEQGVRQFITALAKSLNRLGSAKNVSSKFHLRTQIREKLLLLIRNLTVNDKNSVFQTCLALQTLTARPEELAERSVETASRILQHLGDVMQATQRSMRAKRIEDRFLLSREFIQAMTRVTSNLIEAASILIHRNARISFIRQKAEDNVLLRATEAAEKLIKAKLSVKVLGEQPLLITTPNIQVNATQLTSIGNSLFSLGDVKFHMPVNLEKQLNTESVGKEGSCYGTMMTVYKENPFFSEMHHTKVGSLSLSSCNGEDIEVRNLSSRIRISIPHENHKVKRRTEEFILDWNRGNTHEINRTEKMMNQSLHIHLEVLTKLPPGFVFKLIASTSKTSSENHMEYLVTSSGKAMDLYLSHHQLNASGSVFARVVLEDTAYYRIKSIKKGPSISYSLSVQWMGCFYWNKEVKDWTSDGCEVMDTSTDEMLFCRCNHLTAFSGTFVYPPNSLTIEDLRDAEKLKKAPVTMALVISIMALYFVLLGFCIRADKHDKKKLGAVYISENITGGVSQRFQITVQTGHWFGAGTSANVFLILHGDNCVSDPIELKSTAGKPLFERSSCDVFVLSLPGRSFGNIWKIHIWHDNSGEHPGWFLEHVIVKNVNNGLKWFFNCNRWLAVDQADGKVECELQETSSYSSSLKKCFSQHSSKSILDYHLWFSLFGRPSYSRFSRAQRLTCCVSLLLSVLCVNIAWFRPKTEVPEVLGIIDVTAESIWIGILCSIIALPVNLLWVFLFRYSRRTFRHHVKVYPISEPQTDTTELVSSSVLDQSLETVLILKNIGERKRWFQTVWELDDVRSDTSSCHSMESLGHASDSTSLGYNSGQGALSCTDRPLRNSHAGLLQTCDFLADISPGRKKSLEFDKRSTYSVSMSSTASEGTGAYRSRFSLPHVCVYVAWFGCVLTAGIAGVFTVWYGVSLGWDLSIRWLQSLCFSLLESFLISQPIMVVAFILFMAYKSNIRKEDEEVDEGFEDLSSSALHEIHYGHLNQAFVEEETSREEENVDPALALRRRQRYLKFLKPPSKSKLSEARNKCVQSKALWNYAIELMVYLLFLMVTCLLVTSVISPDVYRLNQSIKKTFIRSEDSQPGSVKDAWKEISAALYENSALSSYTPFTILLRDSQSLLFGRTRITQYNTGMLTACDKDSGGSDNQTVCHAQCHAKDGAWISLELNQTSDESAKQLKEITESQWINACTRKIAVEFAVYTPFLRAISAATLSVKALSTGKPECHLELNTFPAFYKSAEYGYFFRVCKLLFVVLFLYLLQHEFFLALKMSKKYFTRFWRLTQLLTVAISSLCVVLYIYWSLSLYALLREVETATQTQVFYYAKLVSWSQETLQASYSLLLFLLIIRCVYLLRPFRGVVRLGKYLASLAHPLLACTVVIATFMMAFVHTGHLLFGRLHSAFKSFGDTFLLVSSCFRLEGVNHYQGPVVEEHPVLVLLYFALFLIGFCVFMRGTTAAVFVCGIPQSKKRRHKLLADFVEDFIRSKLQSLKEKTQRRERTDFTSDEEEDEDDDFDEELEVHEKDASFPMEHVLDEVEDQLQELSLRMDNLVGSEAFDDLRYSSDDLLSFSDRDEDVEYLYQAEQTSPVSSTGYDSDHSNTSAAKWQFSSSSSHDLSDYYHGNTPQFRNSDDYYGKYLSDPGHQASARPLKFPMGGSDLHGLGLASSSSHDMAVYPSGETMKLGNDGEPSCSSCYDMGRNNAGFTYYGEEGLERSSVNHRSFALRDEGLRGGGLRDGVLRDGELRGGFLRDGVWHVGDLRDGILRDEGHGGSFTSDGVCSQDLSSCSSHSLVKRPDPGNEPIRPKTMYGVARTHARRGHEASALRPTTAVDGSSSEAAANSSSDQETGRKTKKTHPRRTKGLFRSSAVYPGHEVFALGPSPPLGESRVQAAWGLAPSASERGFRRTSDSHSKPSASERGPVRSPDSLVAEDSELNSPAWGLGLPTSPDPHVPDAPVKGLLGDISMNRRLGTEIINDDSPESSTRR